MVALSPATGTSARCGGGTGTSAGADREISDDANALNQDTAITHPRTVDHRANHGGSWEGTPTYAEQKGNYPFVAEHLDLVKTIRS